MSAWGLWARAVVSLLAQDLMMIENKTGAKYRKLVDGRE